jgi:hypothetical protein
LKTCKEIDIILHGMLIYGIVRVIEDCDFISYLSCIIPKGNGYINVVLNWRLWRVLREVQVVKLDPEASTEVSLIAPPQNRT